LVTVEVRDEKDFEGQMSNNYLLKFAINVISVAL